MHPGKLSIKNFTYHLPEEKIALFPSAQRDESKLLIFRQHLIQQNIFKNIPDFIQGGSRLFFNNTSVVPARLHFEIPGGKEIEIFCLGPLRQFENHMELAFHQKNKVKWKCLIGGAKKWKHEPLKKTIFFEGYPISLTAEKIEKKEDHVVIQFSWENDQYSFDEMLKIFGEIPLPPYIKRALSKSDEERYQTTYAAIKGSVAAPTAGLHFTQNVFDRLTIKNIEKSFLTLHVGAGTFLPVKTETMQDHDMHSEVFEVKIAVLDTLMQLEGKVIAVGTTTLRVLESLYWMGLKVKANPSISVSDLATGQWEPYEKQGEEMNTNASLNALKNWMQANKMDTLYGSTKIIIAPGYSFRVVNALITNFHQPGSTLLLLVAAFIGEKWRMVYDYALKNDFRFLSYGDSCLLYSNTYKDE
ncbi:MAG: S-adenosylmethionine:tRNA ribosyltransferase-isomerase [Bacteroidetes bacterium]|nr:S-adenosylmethionine:tRNA ribosyltransferase-isomerase [Bacteroidota bacterium]